MISLHLRLFQPYTHTKAIGQALFNLFHDVQCPCVVDSSGLFTSIAEAVFILVFARRLACVVEQVYGKSTRMSAHTPSSSFDLAAANMPVIAFPHVLLQRIDPAIASFGAAVRLLAIAPSAEQSCKPHPFRAEDATPRLVARAARDAFHFTALNQKFSYRSDATHTAPQTVFAPSSSISDILTVVTSCS
ncbi:hypothetical protein MSAN_01703700 [Mycena sanguinolenta]|uniref:Uncharacterized protein n=1 Tax=Mycena sanguinolenta TaxID=230812 RepID=A0A8H7CTK9_9AGAR|nr:hypothetical protein MSAN_01703700 [Mycena sanguinolenta]